MKKRLGALLGQALTADDDLVLWFTKAL